LIAYALRRLGLSVLVVVGVSIAVFMMLRLVPGNPVTVMLSQNAGLQDAKTLTRELGLDKPLWTQYYDWASQVLFHGNLGQSIRLDEPVMQLILQRYPTTLVLTFTSLVFAIVLGIALGVVSAVFHNKPADHVVRVSSLIGVSMPSFWLGIMLLLVFGLWLRILPIAGNSGWTSVILPAITLALLPLGIITRVVRSALLEILGEDYIRTARAKGVRELTILIRHALPNSLIPLITVVGVQFGTLLGGAIIVETVFAWPGIGQLLINAVSARDFPLIQGIVLFIAIGFVLVNLAVDLLYAYIDPRIRDQMEAMV
jgi:peptide/nickel transport system permease protein